MTIRNRKAFLRFNEHREKKGLPPVSRREFMRLAAMSAAGLSVHSIYSCGNSTGTPDGPANVGGGFVGTTGGAPPIVGGSPPFAGGGPAGTGGVPASTGGVPTSTGGVPTSTGGIPAGTGGVPADTGGVPAGTGGGGSQVDAGPPLGGTGGGGVDSGPVPGQKTLVGLSRNADIVTNTRTAIDLAGGLSDIKGGDRVVIKPNLVGPYPDTFTDVEVLRGVIQAVAAHTNPSNITLAECTALGMDTQLWAEMVGYTALCQAEGINFVAWDRQPYVFYQDPKWQYIKEAKQIPQMLDPTNVQYDHFISVPKLKNHQECPYSTAVFTCCIKLFVGVIAFDPPDGGGRWTPRPDGIHDEYLGQQCAELHCIVPKKLMNVIDSTSCVPVNGPAGDNLAFERSDQDGYIEVTRPGLVAASRDMAACDSVGLAILKHYAKQMGVQDRAGPKRYVNRSVWEDAQIRRAAELGLGVADPAQIEIIDSGVDNIQQIKAEWI